MEQIACLENTPELLCDFCKLRFPRSTFIKHLTEHIAIPDHKHVHFLWCYLCSPLLRHSDEGEDYLRERNAIDGNVVREDNPHLLQNRNYFYSSMRNVNDFENEQSNDDSYGSADVSEWHRDCFYNTGLITWAGFPFVLPDNFYDAIGDVFSVNLHLEVSNTLRQIPFFEPHPEATTAEIPRVEDATCAEPLPEDTTAEIPRVEDVTCAEPHPEDTTAEMPPVDVACVEPHSEVTIAELSRVEDIACVEPRPEASNAEILHEGPTYVEPQAEATKYETPSEHMRDKLEFTENIPSKSPFSELPNAKNQSNNQNQNRRRRARNATNHANSFDSNNLDSSQNFSSNVSNHAFSRPTSRGNSPNVSGSANSHHGFQSSSGRLSLRNYNSRRVRQTNENSSSYNTNYRQDESESNYNGFANASNRKRGRNSHRNSVATSSRGGGHSDRDQNSTYNANPNENESDVRTRENGEISGASLENETSKGNLSYSEAVKRGL